MQLTITKTILSLCDYSGVWSQPFADAGYEVIRVDLQHEGDVRLLEYPGRVHGILAAPPCRVFCRPGARLWQEWGDKELLNGLSIVDACLRLVAVCRPAWWALENPPGRLDKYLGPPSLPFHPWEFGDAYTKHTPSIHISGASFPHQKNRLSSRKPTPTTFLRGAGTAQAECPPRGGTNGR